MQKLLLIGWTLGWLLLPTLALAQTNVTQGPVRITDRWRWQNPSEVSATDAATFVYRLRDSATPGIVTEITGFTCTGAPVICTAPMTQANVDALNRVGVHNLTLALFRADVGESLHSDPFVLRSPAGAPSSPAITRPATP